MKSDWDLREAAALFDLLSHQARLHVLKLTLEDEWDVTSLSAAVGLTQSALSQHLKKLRDGKLVDVRRDAQMKYYRCSDPTVAVLIATLESLLGRTLKSEDSQRLPAQTATETAID